MNCTRCGEVLDLEKEKSPQRDKSGDTICEERFNEDSSKEIPPEYLLVTENAGKSIYTTPGFIK